MTALQGIPEDLRSRIGSIRGNTILKSLDKLENSLVLDRGDVSLWIWEFNGLLKMLLEGLLWHR